MEKTNSKIPTPIKKYQYIYLRNVTGSDQINMADTALRFGLAREHRHITRVELRRQHFPLVSVVPVTSRALIFTDLSKIIGSGGQGSLITTELHRIIDSDGRWMVHHGAARGLCDCKGSDRWTEAE